MGHATGTVEAVCRAPTIGANTKINSKVVAIFSATIGKGNKLKAIARTTMFSAGELNIAASTDSVLIPDAYIPRPMGATQLAYTPSGIPAAAPIREFK